MTILRSAAFDAFADGTTALQAGAGFDFDAGDGATAAVVATASGVHGGKGLRYASGTYGLVGWNLANAGLNGATDPVYIGAYVTKHAEPTQNATFLTTQSATQGSAGQIRVRSNNQIVQVRRNTLADADSTATFNAGNTWRFEWRLDFATASQEARIWYGANLEGTTPDETLLAGLDSAPTIVAFGCQAAATGFDFGYDSLVLADTWPGPWTPPGGGSVAAAAALSATHTTTVNAAVSGAPGAMHVIDGAGTRTAIANAYVLDGAGARTAVSNVYVLDGAGTRTVVV